MIGYKVFNEDWTCRDFQYEVGKTYELNAPPVPCDTGFHFCEKLADCFSYYDFDPKNKVAIVEALGDIETDGKKSCTNKIFIKEELTWHEVLDLVNTGKSNTGNRNSGDCNSGDCNSGNRNSGDWNSGDYSFGVFNTKENTISMFDKPSDMTLQDWFNCDARYILKNMPTPKLLWICDSDMTEEEKKYNPQYKTTRGYLKAIIPTEDEKQEWWDGLPDSEKKEVLDLPNFDADIFERITGIKVEMENE